MFLNNHTFYIFDLNIALSILKIILNNQNSTINGFSSQNPMKNRYYTSFLALLVKNSLLLDLEIDLLPLAMTLNNKNKFRNGLSSQDHIEEVLHLFLALFFEKSYLTLKLSFDLEFTKLPEFVKLALIGF